VKEDNAGIGEKVAALKGGQLYRRKGRSVLGRTPIFNLERGGGKEGCFVRENGRNATLMMAAKKKGSKFSAKRHPKRKSDCLPPE